MVDWVLHELGNQNLLWKERLCSVGRVAAEHGEALEHREYPIPLDDPAVLIQDIRLDPPRSSSWTLHFRCSSMFALTAPTPQYQSEETTHRDRLLSRVCPDLDIASRHRLVLAGQHTTAPIPLITGITDGQVQVPPLGWSDNQLRLALLVLRTTGPLPQPVQ